MNFTSYLAGSAIVVMATVAQPTITLALEATQIKEIADNIMVRIDINNGEDHGSGVIIARDDSNYYVLTAKHVFSKINQGATYTAIAPDGENYDLDIGTIKNIDGVDMAVVSFKSDRPYKIAQIERSEDKIIPGIPVYINGFPKQGQEIQDGAQFTSGSLTGTNDQHKTGYNLVYSNFTRGGMSGGPVLNEQGHLIGIHGLAEQEQVEKVCDRKAAEADNVGLPTPVGSTPSEADNAGLPTPVGSTEDADCVETAQESEKIDLNLGISIFTFLERADTIGMDGILDTTAAGAPTRPERIAPGSTTGIGCSGVVCP